MIYLRIHWRKLWLALCVSLFLLLAGYQLGLPGLHYDEAKEAGVNAMELLTHAPVTAFRGAAITVGELSLPLMVQDYIGALNVYLALPFLATTGIGVPNLRLLALLLAVLALFFLERAVSEWCFLRNSRGTAARSHAPLSLAALFVLTLLVASPSFVFWNRQGIFVTNVTLPAAYFAIWQGLRWVRTGRERALLAAVCSAGLALYAKLLAIWVMAPFALLLMGWWLWRRRYSYSVIDTSALPLPAFTAATAAKALTVGLLPLAPLLLFNLQTGGTFQSIGANLGQSYYGVDNTALAANLLIRLGQLVETLRGGHFWYLGGLHANPLAPWLWGLLLLAAIWFPHGRRLLGLPLLFLTLVILSSIFTVSDLFITHYALVHPLAVVLAGIALASLTTNDGRQTTTNRQPEIRDRRSLSKSVPRTMHYALLLILPLWLLFDLSATIRYHTDLARSGGLTDHSDATYHLAYYLRYNGLGAPIALDWGMDAPVRYLSEGTVQPIEIFGYESVTEPDDSFALRLASFLTNPENVYLLRAPGHATFGGRREAFFNQVRLLGKAAQLERAFVQRDGTVLFELWRVTP